MSETGLWHFVKDSVNKTLIKTTGFKLVKSSQEQNPAFSPSYTFVDRSSNAENLLLILAGFQPYYWDVVFSKVRNAQKAFHENLDVCVCVPCGVECAFDDIKQRTTEIGWSMLYIKEDRLAQVQNTAIHLHPSAEWIFKIDEDIIISEDYFQGLKRCYLEADSKSMYKQGVISPLLNLNAVGLPLFLNTFNLLSEYQSQFGNFKIRFEDSEDLDIVHKSPDVALFVWKHSIPFDDVSKEIEIKNKGKYSFAPIRLSIGAILIKRTFWEQIGYFKVGSIGDMGVEEVQICSYCMTKMYSITIAEDVFAGHLGFFRQKETCHRFFEENKDML